MNTRTIQKAKQITVVLALISAFLSLGLVTIYFVGEASRYKYHNENLKEELELVRVHIDHVENSLEQVNLHSDSINDLTQATLKKASVVKKVNDLTDSENMIDINDTDARYVGDESNENLSLRLESLSKNADQINHRFRGLTAIIKHRQEFLSAIPSITPTSGWVSSHFGKRRSPFHGQKVMHNGVDIGAEEGTPIYATADGIVVYANDSATFGKLVAIDHGYNIMTKYAHTSKILVRKGQKIRRGDIVAKVGSTGQSTGPHLHYEVWVNNHPVDPIDYFIDRDLDDRSLLAGEKNLKGVRMGGEEILEDYPLDAYENFEEDVKNDNNQTSTLALEKSVKQLAIKGLDTSDYPWKRPLGLVAVALAFMLISTVIPMVTKGKKSI